MFSSHIGEYFVELSIKLGSDKYLGSDSKSINSLVKFSQWIYKFVKDTPESDLWDWNTIDESIETTNKILGEDTKNTNKAEIDRKRRLQSQCSSGNWHLLGNGRCDSSLNTAACNYDNGDCCSHTCKSYSNYNQWSDNKSPPDDNDNKHTVYSCGSNGYNCLPDCNVANSDWIGDGYCDQSGGYNTAECNYDNGDCCENTCNSGSYTCGSNGYNCIDSSPNYASRLHCDNPCFGLCGMGCSCWKWSCGDCYSHYDCQWHDKYCSCDSLASFWCMNIFWVTCD